MLETTWFGLQYTLYTHIAKRCVTSFSCFIYLLRLHKYSKKKRLEVKKKIFSCLPALKIGVWNLAFFLLLVSQISTFNTVRKYVTNYYHQMRSCLSIIPAWGTGCFLSYWNNNYIWKFKTLPRFFAKLHIANRKKYKQNW